MLDLKQRHKLLLADRTKDVSWITATIKHLMTRHPDVTLAEVEDVLRAGAGTAYLIATAGRFEVVVGFTAWRDALAKAGITAEVNRAALGRISGAAPITVDTIFRQLHDPATWPAPPRHQDEA
jgi:hypothetical protein